MKYSPSGKVILSTHEVWGSGAKPYIITFYGDGSGYCTCPAWRNMNVPATERVCKHMRKVWAS